MVKFLNYIKILLQSLIKKLNNFYYKEYNTNEKIIFSKNLKANYKNYFIIFIDRSSHAVNFNYLEYLIYAHLISKKRKVILVILPESEAKNTYEKDLNIKSSNDLRFETILKGLIEIIDGFNPSIFICKNRTDAIDFFSFPENQKFPKNASYDKVNFEYISVGNLCKNIQNQKKKGLIKAPIYAKDFVDKILLKNIKKKIVTISIRQNDQIAGAKYNFYRNSDITTWLRFSEWLRNNTEFETIIIPDIELLNLKSDLFEGNNVFREGALDLKLRIALYEKAYVNLSIAAGFSSILLYSSCNFLVFKVGDKRIESNGANSASKTAMDYNIKEGAQLPIFNPRQKLFWGQNTEEFEFIKKSFLNFVEENGSDKK